MNNHSGDGGKLYLFVFGGAMKLAEASLRRRRESAVMGKDFHVACLNGFRRRFGVSLPLEHYIENRGRLVASNGEQGFYVSSLEVVPCRDCFVAGTMIEMSQEELQFMDTLEQVCYDEPENGFMKRIDVTAFVNPLPEDSEKVFAYTGTAESRRIFQTALASRKAGVPAYYLGDCLSALELYRLKLHPLDDLLQLPAGVKSIDMHWES